MNSIIKSFSDHGTFVQPDTLDYILSKDDPKEFTSFITKNLKEFPLILTLDQIKNIEQLKKVEETPKPPPSPIGIKEIQTRMLSELFGGLMKQRRQSHS